MTEPFTSITWLSLRPEYWSSRQHSFQTSTDKINIQFPEPMRGIACVAFAIGASGSDWLDRLIASEWFSGLEPRPDDIAEAGAPPAGQMLLLAKDLCSPGGMDAALKHAVWPAVHVTAVAVPKGSRPIDQFATLNLVSELRARRDGHGSRTTVVVTLEPTPGDSDFELELLRRGAFVVRAGSGADGDHLHHFPLRASVYPRHGRLVCVDLADYLACWMPGSSAELHVLSLTPDLRDFVDLLPRANGDTLALNIDMHPNPATAGNELLELDQFATHCREHFLGAKDGTVLFTTSERLHWETGTVDVVVITRGAADNQAQRVEEHSDAVG